MRLICSTSLDDTDERVIRESRPNADAVDKAITEEIRAALRDPTSLPVVELLATMATVGALDVRVAYKTDQRGIFHTKVGIFRDDDGDAISFEGSANETFMAWSHNEERFKTFRTWVSGGREQVADDQQYFDDLWDCRRPTIIVRPLPDVARSILKQHAHPDPQVAVEKVRTLVNSRARGHRGRRNAPKKLQDHQLAALAAWRTTRSGIIDHVTGGGKTITALACVREWFASFPKGSVLIVVPSILLMNQWQDEIRSELGSLSPHILQAGGSAPRQRWQEHLRGFLIEMNSNRPRVVIATMDTAAKERFRNLAAIGHTTLMIVDEVHKVGSSSRRKVLDSAPGGRLGLSATPARFGDPEGTDTIFDFFGSILPPKFEILDAQKTNPPRLVSYTYEIGVVALNAQEHERYRQLTQRIGALASELRSKESQAIREQHRLTILARARVLKSAAAKVSHGTRVLSDNYQQGQRWLVYCDNTKQLEAIAQALATAGIRSTRYLAEMNSSKPDTIERFERLGGVLLSIRCLDEGIDIPTISHALILASSLNPREHLQRRGRVLRSSPGKSSAKIYDTLVGIDEDGESVRVFSHEIDRARSFASDARNQRSVLWHLNMLSAEDDPEWIDVEPTETEDMEDRDDG